MHISKQFFLLLLCNGVIAQQHWDIEGRLQAANQEILLKGFNMQGDSYSQQPLVMKSAFYLQYPLLMCGRCHTRDKEQ
jgi:hypothetical protein